MKLPFTQYRNIDHVHFMRQAVSSTLSLHSSLLKVACPMYHSCNSMVSRNLLLTFMEMFWNARTNQRLLWKTRWWRRLKYVRERLSKCRKFTKPSQSGRIATNDLQDIAVKWRWDDENHIERHCMKLRILSWAGLNNPDYLEICRRTVQE